MSKTVHIALAALLCILSDSSAQAELLTWTLQGVTFDDGGTATGFFRYDPTTPPCSFSCSDDVVPEFYIKTTPALGFFDEYEPRSVGGHAFIVGAVPTGIAFGGDAGSGGNQLNLLFEGSLPPEGGTVRIAAGSNENFVDALGGDITVGERLIIRGSVTTAVPEPASFVSLLIAGAVWVLLRKSVATKSP